MVEFLKLSESERWLVVKNKLSEGFKKSQIADILQVANSTVTVCIKWGKAYDPMVSPSADDAMRKFGRVVRINKKRDGLYGEVVQELFKMIKAEPRNAIRTRKEKSKKKNKKEVLVTITDLHGGAETRDQPGTFDYSIAIMKGRLGKLANKINNDDNDDVKILILGDLIESFMGDNHDDSWMSLEPGMYGARIVFVMRDILSDFIESIENVSIVGCVTGNHDRVTGNNKHDILGIAGKLIYQLLDETFPDIEFRISDHMVSFEMGGVKHVGLHGHTGSAKALKSKIESKALSTAAQYSLGGCPFIVVYTGHLHEHKVYKETSTYVCMCVPAIFSGNGYSSRGGWSGLPGCIITTCEDGYPSFLRKTLI